MQPVHRRVRKMHDFCAAGGGGDAMFRRLPKKIPRRHR
jgi:hypothetical protein